MPADVVPGGGDALAALLHLSADLGAIVDQSGRIRYANPAAEKFLGPDLAPRSVADLAAAVHPDHAERLAAAFAALEGGGRADGRLRVRRTDGQWRTLEVSAVTLPAESGAGPAAGFVVTATDSTDRLSALDQLAASEGRWQSMVRHSADAAIIVDGTGALRYVSPAATRLFGWSPADVEGQRAFEFVHPDDRAAIERDFEVVLRQPAAAPVRDFRLRRPDGSHRWVQVAMSNRLDDPAVRGLIGNLRDVTDQHSVAERLAASEARYRLIVETTQEGIMLLDAADTITFANARLGEVAGTPAEALLGLDVLSLLDAHARAEVEAARERRGAGDREKYEMRFRRPDGEYRYLQVVWTPVGAAGEQQPFQGSLVLVSDITEGKRAARELARLALHDALTGLPNRALLLDRIEGALTRRRRHGGLVALLLVDIDQFKSVNESLGHGAGDQLLRSVTAQLEQTVRAGDTVARLGADEFVVLTEELEGQGEATALADRLLAAIADPTTLAGVEAVVTASIGVAVTSADGMRAEDLLHRADLAMHRAKVRGPACCEVLTDDVGIREIDRLRTVNELRAGLRRGELLMHYQPLVELPSQRLVGAEALVRWQHPTRGLLGPEHFIDLAEQSGLIRELGTWVLRAACQQAARWNAARSPADALTIAVNLSVRQLSDPRLTELVDGILRDVGLPAESLMLEMTETALMNDADAALTELRELRELGVRLAIDDFGTGYSSLVYLKRFPVDELKIDQSFVGGLGGDPQLHTDDVAIVTSVIGLAQAFGIQVVAEGVESEEQCDALVALGCGLGQGTFFGPPVPASSFVATRP